MIELTREEVIAYISCETELPEKVQVAILASLKELAAIKSQPVPVPVAWMYHDGESPDNPPSPLVGSTLLSFERMPNYRNERALYAHPAPLQPVPVEPVAWCREWEGDSSDLNHIIVEFDKSELDEPLERWTPLYTVPVAPSQEVLDELNKLHKLYAAPALTQQERDAERERGDQWETTATNLLARAEKAEEALKVAQQERDDAVTQLKKWKEDGEHLFCQTCDSCGTDECCPPSQCWQTRAEKTEAENAELRDKLKYYESITTGAQHKAIDAAIDSARNK